MPSDKEIREQQERHPGLRVWGAMPGGLSETSEPGDFPVVPFDDFVAAVAAARADERERAAERVEALPVRQLDYWEVVARGHVLAAIDGVEKP